MDRQKKDLVRGPAEANWKRTCSTLHAAFCSCGDWTQHIKPKKSCRDTAVGTDEKAGVDVDDDTLVDILDATEEVDAAIDAAIAEAG